MTNKNGALDPNETAYEESIYGKKIRENEFMDLTYFGLHAPKAPNHSSMVIINSAGGMSSLEDDDVINNTAQSQKTHSISFETSSDISTTQVIYEQGGTMRGLNFIVESGKLYVALWNKAEEDWGFKEMEVTIEANKKYVSTLVMDGAYPANGSAALYVNGKSVAKVSGIGILYEHSDNIGIGEVAQKTLLHGSPLSDATKFSGTIEKIAHYNSALGQESLDQLHDFMSHQWLPVAIEDLTEHILTAATEHDFQTLQNIVGKIEHSQISKFSTESLGKALLKIADLHEDETIALDNRSEITLNVMVIETVGHFLSKFSDVIELDVLKSLVDKFIENGNLDGFDAVKNNISVEQAIMLKPEDINLVVDNSYTGDFSDGSIDHPFTDVQSAITHAGELRQNPDARIVIEVKEGNSNNTDGETYGHFRVDVSNITIQGTDLPRFSTPNGETGAEKGGALRGGDGKIISDIHGKAIYGTVNIMEVSDVKIDGLSITGSHNVGIYVSGSDTIGKEPDAINKNIVISNNIVTNTNTAGISVSGTREFLDNPIVGKHYLENVIIENNTVSFTNIAPLSNTEAISLGGGTNNFQIIRNTVHDTEQYGIDVKVGAKDGVIANNHVYNVERFGIYLDAANRTIENVKIEDNLIHNVRNGIVLARETGNPKAQDVGTDDVTIDPNFIGIDITNNTVFSTEGHGILVYRHNTKDGHGGIFDFNIRDNTIFDWGLNTSESKYASSEAIRIAPNLADVTIIDTSLDNKGQTDVKINLTTLTINGEKIIVDGVLNGSHASDLSSKADSVNNILNSSANSVTNPKHNGDDFDNLYEGTSEANIYAGHGGNDTIIGRGEQDKLYGGTGDDNIRGNRGDDIIFGGDGNDIILGDAGNDILIGDGSNTHSFIWNSTTPKDFMENSGDDFIFGGDGDDVLIGLSGNDTLRGGKGNDILYGNDGSDRFVFQSADLHDFDTIKDFSLDENDVLDISNVLESFDPISSSLDDFVQVKSDGKSSIISVDIDGGGDNFKQIFLLENVKDLDLPSLIDGGHLII